MPPDLRPRSPRLPALAAPALALTLSLLAAGCNLAPPRDTPLIVVPADYKEAARAAGTGIWQPARADAAPVPDAWWTLYGDPALDALQAQAMAGNPGIAVALGRLRAAQAALATSRAGLFPAVSGTLGATRSVSGSGSSGTVDASGNPVGSTGGTPRTLVTLGATASWEADLWGRIGNQVDAAGATLQASADDVAALRLSTQGQIAQTYFSLRAAEAQARLLQDTIAGYERSLAVTRNRYQAGVAASVDVAQAETQLQSARAQRIESDISRAQLEHALAALAGVPPAAFTLPPAVGDSPLPPVPAVPAALASRLLERRPDIAAAERRVAAANAQVGVARAAIFPALTFSASAGYRGTELADLVRAPNLFWSIGPQLALSLFDAGARRAAVESAWASLDQAAGTYRQTVIAALQEVEDNLVAAAELEREAAVQQAAVAAARKAAQVTDNQYRAGLVSYLNVVTAQASLLSAQSSALSLHNRRLAATAQLLKNIGGRWEPVAPAR